MKEAAWLTLLWTAIAAGAGVWIWTVGATDQGASYVTAYVAERALSIDNLFVFLVIFNYFGLPTPLRARGLLCGIVGALIARAIFIALGVAAISRFSWFLYVLGAFLIYTAYKLVLAGGGAVDPRRNLFVRLFRRMVPVTDTFDGHKFFTRTQAGALAATPFLLVVIVLGTTDAVFAVDSIPTVFGITSDAFIVWSSNAMAVLAMRPLFFLLAGLVNLFRYLQYGLGIILGFVGVKMIVETAFPHWHLTNKEGDIFVALGVILFVLFGSVMASIIVPDNSKRDDEPLAVDVDPSSVPSGGQSRARGEWRR